MRGALAINRFPTFCGVLVGGSSLLEAPIQHLLTKTLETLQFGDWKRTVRTQRRSARFLSTLLAAWLGFALLNYRPKEHDRETKGQVNGDGPNAVLAASVPVDDVDPAQSSAYGRPQDLATTRSPESPGVKDEPAGRTIDLTLFAATRAADVLIGELWSRRKSDRIVGGQWTRLEEAVGRLTDAGVFAVSASLVMWAWFYIPDRLPRAYNNWIRDAAEVDGRLVTALRRARRGEFVYGEDTGQAPMLQGMCRDYDLPLEWGDPARCIPLPCEVVHMGAGPSCERHAASRFLRAFKFSLTMYLPLNLLLRARSPSARALQQALKDAIRSSTFLAAFISLFYYGICLGRTRAGPRLFGPLGVTAQDWDSGLDVGTGCVMCGWSILIEAERRRQEIAFFVAPRAAATFFPRQYDPKVSSVTRSFPVIEEG